MPVRSAWLINRTETETGQSRADTRLSPVGTMAPNGALSSTGGVIPGSAGGEYLMSGLYVFGESAGMKASVAPGRAVIQGRGSAGAYPVVLTDYTDVTFGDGNASNPRIDLVVLRVHDAQVDGGVRTEAVLEVIEGEPEATPQSPQLPEASLPLARVTVPAGASVGTGGIAWADAVYDMRVSTVAVGGILADSWNRETAGGYPGQYRDTSSTLQRWDGTRWVNYARQIGGIAPQGALAAGEYTGQYRDEAGRLQRWDGTVWRPAVPSTAWANNTDGGYCASTSWVEAVTDTVGPTITATFTVPVTGAVLVTVGFMGNTGVDGQWSRMGVNIRKDGVLVVEANEVRSATVSSKALTSVSATSRVTGLQPGAVYTAVSAYCSSAASNKGWFDNRFIRVDPLV
ncbi:MULTISPECIES: hypothetical protein [Streptomyces]|uniref:Minor tail protein n=1 Tax=Streptomyces glycanivorans TaxID=3033808 RepID=A0ABY9JEC5_9ACTN|nr:MULTISPECIES: hypothetical protein [unclassified Streptomyces]WSQ78122.1 hypothetical protein OG725_13815 [Streptomyces sp. NBC_01213]TXS17549.1 hypothetical protein EAO68_07160 [Streptomyces sp. wa22]WLQ64738.1 hypothetical protein P8A20_14535 [Streptomyces sp. Alt3]WSQ85494.1 hypothetical protein OG722_14485 [Streptomyces sp. NBC_01212]WSR08415.1 hypothetical protein OG265_21530 [Streptomyces sp. NBC_01208]